MFLFSISQDTLDVKTVVFPDPAPAKTTAGPFLCIVAATCSLFSFDRRFDMRNYTNIILSLFVQLSDLMI